MFGFSKPKRVLTLGLVQGNRPLIERTLKGRSEVSIGSHPKNTFSIASDRLPKKFVVFKPQGERYLLYFLPSMSGKIAVNDSALSLTSLIERGVVETKNGTHSVSISDKTRGKIIFEGYHLLFRFDENL